MPKNIWEYCYPEFITGVVCLSFALVLFAISIYETWRRENNGGHPKNAYEIKTADDFERVINRIQLPFQFAKYGFSRLYTHHYLVTGWIKTKTNDYLLMTIEYDGAAFPHGLAACWVQCKIAIRNIFKRIFFGQVKIKIRFLKDEISPKRPILLFTNEYNVWQQQAPRPDNLVKPNRIERIPSETASTSGNPVRNSSEVPLLPIENAFTTNGATPQTPTTAQTPTTIDFTSKNEELDNAKTTLWPQNVIDEFISIHQHSRYREEIQLTAEPNCNQCHPNDCTSYQCALGRENKIDKKLFCAVASRAKEILHEPWWNLTNNNCEHLANYLLTGRHWSTQCEEAHFFKRILLHTLGPLVELPVVFLFCAVLPHFLVFILASYLKDKYRYAISIVLIYVIEFLSAGWTIGNMISLEAQARSTRCTATVIQVLVRSSLDAAAISLGIMFGHWFFKCRLYLEFWSDVIASLAFFIGSHWFIFPLLAAGFDYLIYKKPWQRMLLIRIIAMVIVCCVPIAVLAPFWFMVIDDLAVIHARRNSSSDVMNLINL